MKYEEISKFEQEAIRKFMARDPKEINIRIAWGTEKFCHFGYEEV